MKIQSLHVYPIKALRGIPLEHAQLGSQGIRYDRRFMLYTVRPTGEWKKMQLDSHPQCALFEQQIVHRADSSGKDASVIVVRYHQPAGGAASESESTTSSSSSSSSPIEVPLNPDISSLEAATVDLHGSPASASRMGEHYDSWFTDCFGIPAILVYIGDGKRAVLGNTLPPKAKQQQPKQPTAPERQRGWMSSLASYVTGPGSKPDEPPAAPWLTFTDVAPFLVTSESSLKDVCARFPDDSQPVGMFRFRPNIVVDGDGEDAWAEDFWTELTIGGPQTSKLALTGNCGRCTSLNVDYQTGKPSTGEMGNVLKKLMRDRRVDPGVKYSPVFGRYAFLETAEGGDGEFVNVSVGDEVQVTGRSRERSVWDWPGL
ncbi:hypothetical protein B0T22DRAFT_416048 [Podospora appendiculata]|uniref:MOSC domain-containing protein n=1 Tax=Podospora appendiculata TaxID=314037 RepID=A0AAE1CF18_9PEZI|nr:hypothetical protein B0T22DRAFT_416048 [Podospora appendiculata]